MKYVATLVFLLFSLLTHAQKAQNIYFVTDRGTLVSTKDSADFIRVIQEPDSGAVNYILKEFYKDGSKKRIGAVSQFTSLLILEGVVIDFYPNGRRKQIQNHVDGKTTGDAFYFYPNGKLREQRFYQEEGYDSYKTLQYADSTGKTFLDETGSGHFEIALDANTKLNGSYLNGLRSGDWTGYMAKDTSTYIETFKDNRFIGGKRSEKNGKVIPYKEITTFPEFKGGFENFVKFMRKNQIDPVEARGKKNIGVVNVKFVVQEDGSLNEVRVVKELGLAYDKEALRLIKASPKWIPATFRGKSVPFDYTIPVNFPFGTRP